MESIFQYIKEKIVVKYPIQDSKRDIKFTWRRVIVTIAELRRSCTCRASRARRCLSHNDSFSTRGMSISYLYIELIGESIVIMSHNTSSIK